MVSIYFEFTLLIVDYVYVILPVITEWSVLIGYEGVARVVYQEC